MITYFFSFIDNLKYVGVEKKNVKYRLCNKIEDRTVTSIIVHIEKFWCDSLVKQRNNFVKEKLKTLRIKILNFCILLCVYIILLVSVHQCQEQGLLSIYFINIITSMAIKYSSFMHVLMAFSGYKLLY